jgi:hypothetical protein
MRRKIICCDDCMTILDAKPKPVILKTKDAKVTLELCDKCAQEKIDHFIKIRGDVNKPCA